MSIYINGKTYWVRIYHDGGCLRESTGTTDKKEAQRYHDERKAELWTKPRTGKTWKNACIAWLEAGERSASDRYSLRAMNYPDRPLTECTPESFQEALSEKSPATFNRYRALIVAILSMSGHEIKIPLKKVKAGRLRFLTSKEWDKLHKSLPDHLKALALFSIKTGLRQHNATHLKWSEIDLQRKVMWIHADEAKSEKAIGIPLSDDAVAVLRGQIGKSEEWVFPYKGRGRKEKGKPITKIKGAWRNALERAGLGEYIGEEKDRKFEPDFTWHGLRHTWASWHVMSGTPLEVLQKLGGWNDLRMVMRYAHLAPEYLAGFANNAKPYKPVLETVLDCA